MATFRKRGTRWQAVVRRQGHPVLTKTFKSKGDASLWARQIEHQADTGCLRDDPRVLAKITLGDLIKRYRDEITPKKRGHVVENAVLTALLRRPLCEYSLEQLSPKHLAELRDLRAQDVGAAAVNRDLSLIQHAIKIAQQEWGIPISHNPVALVRKLKRPPGRDRRLCDGELDALISASRSCRNTLIAPLIRFAVESGMRRGEILALTWKHVDVRLATAHLPITKNGFARTVPLTPNALTILSQLPDNDGRVFPMSAEAAKLAWQRLTKRTGIKNLRFHDLRHEATSRFFEMGLSMPEVALITGHKDGRMLFRYTHLKPENVALKLASISNSRSQVQVDLDHRGHSS